MVTANLIQVPKSQLHAGVPEWKRWRSNFRLEPQYVTVDRLLLPGRYSSGEDRSPIGPGRWRVRDVLILAGAWAAEIPEAAQGPPGRCPVSRRCNHFCTPGSALDHDPVLRGPMMMWSWRGGSQEAWESVGRGFGRDGATCWAVWRLLGISSKWDQERDPASMDGEFLDSSFYCQGWETGRRQQH